jgi:hypothetical protein
VSVLGYSQPELSQLADEQRNRVGCCCPDSVHPASMTAKVGRYPKFVIPTGAANLGSRGGGWTGLI